MAFEDPYRVLLSGMSSYDEVLSLLPSLFPIDVALAHHSTCQRSHQSNNIINISIQVNLDLSILIVIFGMLKSSLCST